MDLDDLPMEISITTAEYLVGAYPTESTNEWTASCKWNHFKNSTRLWWDNFLVQIWGAYWGLTCSYSAWNEKTSSSTEEQTRWKSWKIQTVPQSSGTGDGVWLEDTRLQDRRNAREEHGLTFSWVSCESSSFDGTSHRVASDGNEDTSGQWSWRCTWRPLCEATERWWKHEPQLETSSGSQIKRSTADLEAMRRASDVGGSWSCLDRDEKPLRRSQSRRDE